MKKVKSASSVYKSEEQKALSSFCGERITGVRIGQRRYAVMQGLCVSDIAGNGVGQVDLVPAAVQVDLVPCVIAGTGVALVSAHGMPSLRHIAANREEKS